MVFSLPITQNVAKWVSHGKWQYQWSNL